MTNLTTKTPAERIKSARSQLNMTQAQFAKAIGLDRPKTISDYESGRRTPKQYFWRALDSLIAESR